MPDPFSIGADVLNLGLSLYNNQKNRQFAEQQATTAYNRQLSLWNMQNEYNTPANQVSRIVQAGLNPNLAYGQLQTAGLTAPSVAQGAAYNQNDPQLRLNNMLAAKQVERLDTENKIDTQRVEQDIKESLSRIGVNDVNADYLAGLTSTIPLSIAQMEASIENMSYQNRSLGYDICMKALTQGTIVEQYATDLKKSKVELENLGGYFTAQILGLKAQARRDYAAANLSKEQAEVAKALANIYGVEYSSAQEDYQRKLQYNKKYYDSYYQGSNGQYAAPFDWSIRAGVASSEYQAKITSLLQRYGDAKEVMSLIHLGTECFQNVANGIGSFGGARLSRARASVYF